MDWGMFMGSRHKVSEDWTPFQVLSSSSLKSVFNYLIFLCLLSPKKTCQDFGQVLINYGKSSVKVPAEKN